MSHLHSTAPRGTAASRRTLGNHPMAWGIAVALSSMTVQASAQQAFSPAWFADKGAAQGAAAQSGRMPNGVPVNFGQPTQQQDAARQKLQQSIDNLGSAAQAIALQQRMQEQARQSLRNAGYIVVDGMGEGGLKVDENPLTRGWLNAREAIQRTGADGKVEVSIEQTADKAILNWETFNVGSNTTLRFGQNADWAVLNRVNDPNARPSQILGQIKAPGSVFVVNRNGVVFGNNSQVNVRNLVAAATRMSDAQFKDNGLYSTDNNSATLTDAFGDVVVERGARITTHEPSSATRSGGYVLLAGHAVENAGQIETRQGQAQLAAGDAFVIRRGVGTAQNTASTTRGNEIAPQFVVGSTAGEVSNTGLIRAREGDITLAGRTVEQAGVAVATTTVNQRGSVHLLNAISDRTGAVTLAKGSTTAVLIEDDGKATALDSQREAMIAESAAQDPLRATSNSGTFDNLSRMQDRRDQSRIEIVSGGNVAFEGQSLTVATGGQVVVDAAGRSFLADGARVDVAGATGVKVSMESNNVKINVQGNELRDSPDNRDSGKLNNNTAWIDRRELVYVPAGTGGYGTDRWYAAGGLLEVGGYLGTEGHSIGEWAAQGGSVLLGGNEVVTQAGSRINLAGGSLDVATGTIHQTWLRGNDGQLYRLDDAPAAMGFAGLYRGFESEHARWGVTERFRSPVIASESRIENGYTVGRDAGTLTLSAPTVVLEGNIDTSTFQGVRQARGPDAGQDGYAQAQTAVARNAALLLGRYSGRGRDGAFATEVRLGEAAAAPAVLTVQTPLDASRRNTFWMDADTLSAQQWGRLDLATSGTLRTDGSVRLQDGAALVFTASRVEIHGDITSHGGSLQAGNLMNVLGTPQALLRDGRGGVALGDNARIDLSGTWTNAVMEPGSTGRAAWIDGGSVKLESSHDVRLGAGSQVLVDAGGKVASRGDVSGGKGGSVLLRADDARVASDGSGRVTLGEGTTFSALGFTDSGRFTLETGGRVQVGGEPGADGLNLDGSTFASGFASYDINGHTALDVADGALVQVLRPTLRPTAGVLAATDRGTALEPWLAPLYQVDPATGRVTQRDGASLTLRSERAFQGGDLRIGDGAFVGVDSGGSIALRAGGNITVGGTLQARSGHISIDGTGNPLALFQGTPGTRTWRIGDAAVLDASADSFAATDASGRRQGIVHAGGTITVGGGLDWETRNAIADPVEASVVVDTGARLLASGTTERLQVQGRGEQQVASNGGSIVLRSADALYLNGTMEAAAGGTGADGGTLGIAFGGGTYASNAVDAVLVARTLGLGRERESSADAPGPRYGHGYLSVEQIEQGGFDHLSLFGDVRVSESLGLAMGGSLRLHGSIGFAPGSAAQSTLLISAPYLRLAQATWRPISGENLERPMASPLETGSGHRLHASAELVDVRDVVNVAGFDQVDLRSSGDLRLLAGSTSGTASGFTQLAAPQALDITAAQIYPTTGARAGIAVGLDAIRVGSEGFSTWMNPDAVLRIARTEGSAPALPHSVFGTLSLVGPTIEQGGVVRAPLGALRLGGVSNLGEGARVRLLDGSITSTSAAGLSLPYGGTVDGLQWYVDGGLVAPQVIGGRVGSSAEPIGITFNARQTSVEAGALLDLSGGGELTGAAHVSGRGGSVDVLRHALADANPAYAFSDSGNPVYAIVPSYGSSTAPVGMAQGSADPAVGQRIVVPAGVPGLAAGTYTLLPAVYALQPGAFRVELGSSGTTGVAGAVATGTGSWRVAGQQGSGLGGAMSPLLTDLLITPADRVRRHSGYNETTYNSFVASDAARVGVPRGMQTLDAGRLALALSLDAGRNDISALQVAGQTRFNAAAGSAGYAGSVVVTTTGGTLDIVGAGKAAAEGASGAVLEAEALNALNPARMVLGGDFALGALLNPAVTITATTDTVRVREGAVLRAPELVLTARPGGEGIIVEQGATLTTLGEGAASFDATDGYFYQGASSAVFAVSNGEVNLLPTSGAANVDIRLGTCLSTACSGQALVVSEGSIMSATDGRLEIGDNASYGTRRLGLAVSAINLGQADALRDFAANGGLPPGLALNQQVLQQLLQGNTATGAPALETLSLSARDAINVIGSVDLDTRDAATGVSRLKQLVLGAPAVHGYGGAGDRARIVADTLLWDGALASGQRIGSEASAPQGAAMVDRLGSGQLDIIASTIEFGSAAFTRRPSASRASRQLLGFSSVNLQASDRVLFSGKGSLDVYQQQNDYVAGQGWQYSGGALDIATPLLTGAEAAQLAVRTGGALTLHGATATAGDNAALGAELSLQARDIVLDSTVLLASGRLTAKAGGDITLGAAADLDLAGRKVSLLDVDKYSWGGDVELSADEGGIRSDAASRIDLSARSNRGGRLTVDAMGEQGGRVDLAGSILGGASGQTTAGGSVVPWDAGELVLHARQLQDFQGLNQRLNEGGVTGARSFQLGEGDLVVGDEVKARFVDISVDGGSLEVMGRIDASGVQVGGIRLAARDALRVNGTLDAHGSGLRVDSYGKIIDSPNRADIELSSGRGRVDLGGTAQLDLRSGTGVAVGTAAGQNDGVPRGTLRINVPRVGTDDAAINVAGGIRIDGARDIQVNGFRRYTDAPLAGAEDVHGNRPQLVTQTWLDQVVDPDNRAWFDAALGNGDLQQRLAALGTYRLRPGVEIVANAGAGNARGDLVVSGDIDLSGYRYGPQADRVDPARRGFGESAALALRAEGDIRLYGSINDGFAPPPANPDEAGWMLMPSASGDARTPYGADIIVPNGGVQLQSGTRFVAGSILNYAIPFRAMTLPAGTEVPMPTRIASNLALTAGTVLRASVTTADGQVLAAGTVLSAPLNLGPGAVLGAGFRLDSALAVQAQVWPAGAALPADMRLGAAVDLKAGSLIPSMTEIQLAGNQPVNLRPADASGSQGRNWALAPMLPEGTTSWDITAVAGADTGAADMRARRFGASGDLVLADTHYSTIRTVETTSHFVGERVITLQGSLDTWGDDSFAGKPVKDLADMFGMTEDDFCATFAGACGNAPRLVTREGSLEWNGDESYTGRPASELAALHNMTEEQFCARAANLCYGGGTWIDETNYNSRVGSPAWSVLRTGAGDLNLLAAGNVDMRSGFGVYTAGTPTSFGDERDAAFNPDRAPAPGRTSVLGPVQAGGAYDAALAAYQAWYPDAGGNVSVTAGGDIRGDVWAETALPGGAAGAEFADAASGAVGNWLWRQGSGTTGGVATSATSWWINFGTYTNATSRANATPRMVGFTGFGTLGGGNLRLQAGRHVGVGQAKGSALTPASGAGHSTAIVAVVGSTGRVVGNEVVLTGGGDLSVRTAGALNNALQATSQVPNGNTQSLELNGTLVNLRGDLTLQASRIGGIATTSASYQRLDNSLPASDPFTAQRGEAMGGPVLVLGDATALLQARGDAVLGAVTDPGRAGVLNYNAVALDDGTTATGASWFSLWTDRTGLDMVSAGGDLAPGLVGERHAMGRDVSAERFGSSLRYWMMPSTVRLLAASGSIKLDQAAAAGNDVLLTRPSSSGVLEVLAQESILATPGAVAISSGGSDTRLPSPFDPAFVAYQALIRVRDNLSVEAPSVGPQNGLPLFAFGAPTLQFNDLRAGGSVPNRFYAVEGDIIGLHTGQHWELSRDAGETRTVFTFDDVAAPVHVRAGRDILLSDIGGLNNTVADISIVEAGRDIVHTPIRIAGPGNLDVSAGRQIRQEDKASITTTGGLAQGDTRPGASIAVTAGNEQLDYAAVRARYLDPANLADPALTLAEQPGKAAKLYRPELEAWLQDRFGVPAKGDAALALFDSLPVAQQRIFLRTVYHAELRAAGREYNTADSPRFGSYLRGREAIATLLPEKDAAGKAIDRRGDIVMFGGSGVRTQAGGSIDMLAPGGQIVVGVQGEVPPASAGLVTQGQGDIRLFSDGSLLLGLSRVMTTFGGNIQAWSARGDINAGRGAMTSVQYTPALRVYDQWGNVTLSPQAPATGAGIATLAPIAEVPAGDVDLIAPLGTIDAGEAGIRVSGNVNLAALQVLNAANVQVQGESNGLPVLATVNVNALTSASAAASSASQAAQDVMRKTQDDARRNRPSEISVQVLGFGATSNTEPQSRVPEQVSAYDPNSAFQFPQADAAPRTERR